MPQEVAVSCECGVLDHQPLPELDVRSVPDSIRHATVFGALDSLSFNGGLLLVAPHDALPLLAQIQRRTPNQFEVIYLKRGPDHWRLQFTRTGARADAGNPISSAG
jgi:uncharacterized protein (DUF2249 family)